MPETENVIIKIIKKKQQSHRGCNEKDRTWKHLKSRENNWNRVGWRMRKGEKQGQIG